MRRTLIPLAAMLSIVGACSRERPVDPHAAPRGGERATAASPHREGGTLPEHQDESERHEALPTRVRLSAKVITDARIKTAPVESASLPGTVELTGEVAADPDRTARVTARAAGRIVEVRVKEGDRVHTGELLATLESPELARGRAAFTTASAKAQVARQNAQRLENLETKRLAAGQEVAAAEAEAKGLEAEVTAARQTLSAFGVVAVSGEDSAARLSLKAPLDGVVLSRDAIKGDTVLPEKVIVLLGDLSRAYFLGRLFEKDLARVAVGADVEVRLNAFAGEVFTGKVETIGKQLDPQSRTVMARVAIQNHGDLLKVGLFGTARVVASRATPQARHTVVPLSALTRVADKDVVFVRQADDDFEVHPVAVGRTAGGRAEILAGLREGEQVVVDGVFTLKSAVLKGTFGEAE